MCYCVYSTHHAKLNFIKTMKREMILPKVYLQYLAGAISHSLMYTQFHFWLVLNGMDFHTIRFFGYKEWIWDIWNFLGY